VKDLMADTIRDWKNEEQILLQIPRNEEVMINITTTQPCSPRWSRDKSLGQSVVAIMNKSCCELRSNPVRGWLHPCGSLVHCTVLYVTKTKVWPYTCWVVFDEPWPCNFTGFIQHVLKTTIKQ
jgi:hypothetical protein